MKLLDTLLLAMLGLALAIPGSALARRYDQSCGNCGTVVGVEQVRHGSSHLGAGTAIGAVAGGLLGHTIGKGDGRTAATVGGAVAGGAIGHAVEKNNRDGRRAWRFSVNMDNGHRISVTQGDNADIREGDRVRVS
ncbi:MAG: glycine zipper 2TM domain-containing protein, partial [Lysobacterales bacterium]